jgi:integrase
MKGQDFVLDTVRAMFAWAADPQRGNCLPSGFNNPFHRRVIGRRRQVAPDMAGEPDVTVEMAARLLEACDDWQLRVFSPLVFHGLRPSELIFLFHEMLDEKILDVCCIEKLAYTTKGLRNKRLPMLPPIHAILRQGLSTAPQGLVYCRRPGRLTQPPLLGASLKDLVAEFERRCRQPDAQHAAQVMRVRDGVLHDAGALSYKLIQGEFRKVATTLGWPAAATIKDLRHLCNTALANGRMPEHERRYLLGQEPGKGVIVRYTHFNKLAEHYQQAVEHELAPVLQVLRRRVPLA